MQELDSDGLSFTVESQPAVVLTTDRLSEQMIVEGPWLKYLAGRYFLFYSTSWVQLASYHVGVAGADRVTGPYTKADLPVIQTETEQGKYESQQPSLPLLQPAPCQRGQIRCSGTRQCGGGH